MKRHFAWPIVVTAAVHGLLFAIPGGTPDATEDRDAPPAAEPAPAMEITRIVEDTLESGGGGGAVADVPRTPDVPKPATAMDFVVPVTEVPKEKVTAEVWRIDGNPWGRRGDGPAFGPGIDVVKAIDLDRVPRARVQVPPGYPAAARHAGLDGEVVVEFVVDENGRVSRPRVLRSSDSLFDEEAVKAVSRWVFEPGTVGGHRVRFRMALPLSFRLGD